MKTTPCFHCNVSHVCSPSPAAFTTLRAGQIEFNNQFCILKIFIFIPFPETNTFFLLQYLLSVHILFNTLKIQSWTKMFKKMHLVCLILEYFPLKPSSLKILPPKKNNVEGWTEHFCSWLNNTDQGGVGGGAATMLNSPGGSPVSNKV